MGVLFKRSSSHEWYPIDNYLLLWNLREKSALVLLQQLRTLCYLRVLVYLTLALIRLALLNVGLTTETILHITCTLLGIGSTISNAVYQFLSFVNLVFSIPFMFDLFECTFSFASICLLEKLNFFSLFFREFFAVNYFSLNL